MKNPKGYLPAEHGKCKWQEMYLCCFKSREYWKKIVDEYEDKMAIAVSLLKRVERFSGGLQDAMIARQIVGIIKDNGQFIEGHLALPPIEEVK